MGLLLELTRIAPLLRINMTALGPPLASRLKTDKKGVVIEAEGVTLRPNRSASGYEGVWAYNDKQRMCPFRAVANSITVGRFAHPVDAAVCREKWRVEGHSAADRWRAWCESQNGQASGGDGHRRFSGKGKASRGAKSLLKLRNKGRDEDGVSHRQKRARASAQEDHGLSDAQIDEILVVVSKQVTSLFTP